MISLPRALGPRVRPRAEDHALARDARVVVPLEPRRAGRDAPPDHPPRVRHHLRGRRGRFEVDQRSRSTDPREAETRNVAERNPSSSTERARRRMEQTIARVPTEANANETDEKKIAATATTAAGDDDASEPELVRLPSGGSVALVGARLGPRERRGRALRGGVRGEDGGGEGDGEVATKSDGEKPLLVCVEFLAGWCFACRSLHPKMTKIASEEFADVLFLRVRKDECPALCDAMGIEKLPYVHLVSPAGESRDGAAAKIVDAFAVNLTAPKLAKLRAGLRAHSTHPKASDRREPVDVAVTRFKTKSM